MLHDMLQHADKPVVGMVLVSAGFIPEFFTPGHLSTIYYLFLIPPTIYHCYAWFKHTALPVLIDLYRKLFPSD